VRSILIGRRALFANKYKHINRSPEELTQNTFYVSLNESPYNSTLSIQQRIKLKSCVLYACFEVERAKSCDSSLDILHNISLSM
jgi:hypothetical protein